MEKPTIGIKIADGSYFPILEEGNSKRKRLILTTVNDNQESVQIDLYKGEGSGLLDASYVGSLLIENIVQGPKESSEIELKIGIDKNGTLNAEAGDLASDQIESLSISMESLGESAMYDIPEFSLDDESEDL
ncbi:MAG: Hsp70 family protein, partial [Spirochaetales bacterium]|nr:Hsp70 family protein [Spirochaetales bacterium]